MTRRCFLFVPCYAPSAPMFTLELRLAGSELTATLHNRSKAPQRYLHEDGIQPVTLTLVNAAGRTIAPEDTRSYAKFDATPYKDLYEVLEPNRAATLQTATVRKGALRWGPFSWADLPAGRYTATAVFDHQIQKWVDRETKQTGNWTDLWRGQLKSKPVALNF